MALDPIIPAESRRAATAAGLWTGALIVDRLDGIARARPTMSRRSAIR